jgi:hypothetical protein
VLNQLTQQNQLTLQKLKRGGERIMIVSMLTTVDNPFNPFEDFDLWYSYDSRAGYHTLGFLARILIISDELSESDQNSANDRAIDEIIQENVLGLYRRVQKEVPDLISTKPG